jgi:hypothetical protein
MVTQHEQAAIVAQAHARILAAGKYQRDRARRDRQLQRWQMNLVESPETVISCASVGQRVCLDPDAITNPMHHAATPYTVKKVVGEGGDAMHSLQADDGTVSKWHRASELRPATTSPHAAAIAAQQKQQDDDLPVTQGERNADQVLAYRDASQMPDGGDAPEPSNAAADQLLADARQIAAAEKCSLRDAVTRVARRQPALVRGYRLSMDSGLRDESGNPSPAPAMLSLSIGDRRVIDAGRDGKRLEAMGRLISRAQQIQKATQCRWADAMSAASAQDPETAREYLGR